MILVGFSGSFAPYPCSALEGCHDGDVISLTRLPVNNPNPCNAIRMCCERRALSQKTEGYETRRKVIRSFGEPCHVHMGDSVPDFIPILRSKNTKCQSALTFV